MSSYQVLAREKATGKTSYIWCIDDYFGKHKYGYVIQNQDEDKALTEEQFEKQYEIIDQI